MTGPEHGMAGGDRGRLRASHADREHVIGILKAAYVYGLVTKDEFDARISQTLASRTYAELALITGDIPAGLAAVPPPVRPVPARAGAPAAANVTAEDRAIMATAIVAGLAWVAAVFVSPAAGTGLLAGLLALGGTGSVFVSLFLLGCQFLRSRRDRRSGGQLPPQRAINSGPGTGHGVTSAAAAERFPGAGKPRRRSKADAARRDALLPQLSS